MVQLVDCAVETDPVGHVRHAVAEFMLLKVPLGQLEQPGPPSNPKVPGWQGVQPVRLAFALVRAGQAVQIPAPAPDIVSFAHGVHGPVVKSFTRLA